MILSLDLSSVSSGYAVISPDGNILESDTIIFKAKKIGVGERLFGLYKQLDGIIKSFNVKTIIIEDIFSGLNSKTLILLSEFRGVVRLLAAFNECQFEIIATTSVKSFMQLHKDLQLKSQLAYWKSNKALCHDLKKACMIRLVEERFGIMCENDDQSDSIAIGMFYISKFHVSKHIGKG